MIAVQLVFLVSAIPLRAIFSPNSRTIRLKVEAYDPVHFMKGRYVALTFDSETIPVNNLKSLSGKSVKELQELPKNEFFCLFSEPDANGFSHPVDLSPKRPPDGAYYVAGCRAYFSEDAEGKGDVSVSFPVNRYYLQEDLAPEAERLLREADGSDVVVGLEFNGIPVEKMIQTNADKRPR